VAKESKAANTEVETDADRYPKLRQVFTAILDAEDIPQEGVNHLEVHCGAGGDATYRVYTPGADEAIVGYFAKVSN
jgi:hypothetical protein